VASDLELGDPRRHSPTRGLRLRGAFGHAIGRPAWSSLDENARPRLGREPIEPAWSRRYAALAPAVQELCQRLEAGRSPLDPETLLGEVDWAVRNEDCLAARDFFLRRTDLGYGPRTGLHAMKERVLERLASALSWSSERLRVEREDLTRALSELQAWREEVSNPTAPLPPGASGQTLALKPL
jgi:glycerol-3-phosphate dehydrogenase